MAELNSINFNVKCYQINKLEHQIMFLNIQSNFPTIQQQKKTLLHLHQLKLRSFFCTLSMFYIIFLNILY